VDRLHAVVLEVTKNHEALGFQGRREALSAILRETFHFPAMARFAVGDAWGSLASDQRQSVAESFARVITASFADRFSFYYRDQGFTTLSETPAGNGFIWVDSQIDLPFGYTYPIRYLARAVAGQMRLIDVMPGDTGHSEMLTKRQEFASVFRRQGVSGFLYALLAKVEAIETR